MSTLTKHRKLVLTFVDPVAITRRWTRSTMFNNFANFGGQQAALRNLTLKALDIPMSFWGGLTAVIGIICTMTPMRAQAGDTKPFKETGLEPYVTGVLPGSFGQQLFVDARQRYGTEVWAGVAPRPVFLNADLFHGLEHSS